MALKEKLRCLFWVAVTSPVILAGFLWVKIEIAWEVGREASLEIKKGEITDKVIKEYVRTKIEGQS